MVIAKTIQNQLFKPIENQFIKIYHTQIELSQAQIISFHSANIKKIQLSHIQTKINIHIKIYNPKDIKVLLQFRLYNYSFVFYTHTC